MSDPIVRIEHMSFYRNHRMIFDDISFDVPQGKIVGVMGPSGTGKTTLLSLIGAQLKPTSGRILLNGENIHNLSKKELYLKRRQMGMLFQSGALFTGLSVFENIAFPLRELTKLPEKMIRHIVLMKLEAVGLRGTESLMPSELSGGMARRIALARAIVLDPKLMMYDEPFTGLDPIAKAVIVQLVKNLNDTLGITSIVVSHDIAETCAICDYIFILANGKLLASGAPDQLQASQDEQVKQFMLGLPDGKIPFKYSGQDYQEELME